MLLLPSKAALSMFPEETPLMELVTETELPALMGHWAEHTV
jgi:hypothetical protein